MPVPIPAEKWGETDGKSVYLYTLKNKSGVVVKIINYGGAVTEISVPDKQGNFDNVTLGFDSLAGYLQPGNPCFGCLVGRYANRIANARFTLDNKTYTLAANNNGNSLHGGLKGYDKIVWDATLLTEKNGLLLRYKSKDGEEGFPGTLSVDVTYILTEDNALEIAYEAVTDAPTVLNLTNHAYFNLSNSTDDTILDHWLHLPLEQYTVANDKIIPTGEIASVKGTPLDFTAPKKVGKDISKVQPGYDHNFIIPNPGTLRKAGSLYHEQSGRLMEVSTTQPGIQLYTGNFLNGKLKHTYKNRIFNQYAGLCLETQHYPDSPNQPDFPSTVLRPGEIYKQLTVYRFSTK